MVAGGLHVHDEKIKEVQSNVVSIGDQLLNATTQLSLWEQRTKRLEADMHDAIANIWSSLENSEGREDYTWRPGNRPLMYSYAGEAKAPAGARPHAAASANIDSNLRTPQG